MNRRDRTRSGFTLVEVLVALSLLGITMATVVALFASGRQLRAATREDLAFQRDARLLVETLRDDLANLVPSGPRPMITADSIVLWRLHEPHAETWLVTYQWSGSVEQDSLLVRVTTPLLLDPADIVGNLHHAFARPEFADARYSVLMTGPSATADIEGVLIHGAQGARSLTVALVAKGGDA